MPIPASQIVTVNPRLLTPGGNDLEFNGLLLSASEVIPSSQMALPFPDADSVGKYFGLDSPEYQAAAIYFQGYNNSFTKPRAFYVGRRVTEDAAPFIRGGAFNALPSATLAALREIRDGGMSLMLGSYRGALGSVDFSGAIQPIQGLDEFVVRHYGKEFLKSGQKKRLEGEKYYVRCVK